MGAARRHPFAELVHMDLFTRCPKCETVFRVTTRHLQASGGQVRCGRCQRIFDAFASLTAKPPAENQARAGQEESQPSAPVSEGATKNAATPAVSTDVAIDSQSGARAESRPVVIAESSSQALSSSYDESVAPKQPADSSEPVSRDLEDDADEPVGPTAKQTKRGRKQRDNETPTNLFEWEFKPAPAIRRTGLWSALSLLLLICAIAQVAYIFRTDLMVRYPQLQPVYQSACDWLSCQIELPRLADQLNIDASDLQLVDPDKANIVQLTALVRNRAGVPVEYPAFELTLTNAQQQVVARRIFMPADYLGDSRKAGAGLGGHQELAVNLYLDTGPLRAAGYRIYLFYPPPS